MNLLTSNKHGAIRRGKIRDAFSHIDNCNVRVPGDRLRESEAKLRVCEVDRERWAYTLGIYTKRTRSARQAPPGLHFPQQQLEWGSSAIVYR